MIRDLLGRDVSRDLDRHITGNYGEDQLKGGSMRQPSKHFSDRHLAVAAVACPVCQQPKGTPCVVKATGRRRERHGNETHVGRVNKFEREALPGEPGSVLPPSPVDTDNDCAP